MLELQFPEPSTYAHSPGEVPQHGFKNMNLFGGQGILAGRVGKENHG
jgi:hypothetical protein